MSPKQAEFSFGVRVGGLGNTGLTQYRSKTYAFYNPFSSYASSHNMDWGSNNKAKWVYSERKRKPGMSPEKPHQPVLKDKTLIKTADQIAIEAFNGNRLVPLQLNRPLEFSPERFRPRATVNSSSPLAVKCSQTNLQWIEQERSRQTMQKVDAGEYIPSIKHLDLYGRRKQPSKFEQYGLWISRSPIA